MTNEEDTLIIVTGDHSHAFDIQGYSYRGNDILGNSFSCFIPITFQDTISTATVQPAKSDSGVMFCLQSYQDLESIDHLCINPIHRIGLIHQ